MIEVDTGQTLESYTRRARITPLARGWRMRDTLSDVGSFLSATASPGRESYRVRGAFRILARIHIWRLSETPMKGENGEL